MSIWVQYMQAQMLKPAASSNNHLLYDITQTFKTDSGLIVIHYYRGGCKNFMIKEDFIPDSIDVLLVSAPKENKELTKSKLLTIHGNISYDFFYRSKIDTPINQQNFQQHTERMNLDLLYKEKYPLKVSLAGRQSNSPYFRNFFDVNFLFDKYTYNKNLKQDLLNKINTQMPEDMDIKLAEARLKEQMTKYTSLKSWLDNPATLQKIIEERERIYLEQLTQKNNTPNPLNAGFKNFRIPRNFGHNQSDKIAAKEAVEKNKPDSINNKFYAFYQKEKTRLDTLVKNINKLQKRADSLKNSVQKEKQLAKQKIYKATSEDQLKKIAADNGVKLDKKDKTENFLTAIKSFSLGRSILNYTELTAQNITLTGVNVEYNPSWYAAFAAGKIDYRFRDFFNRNAKQNGQYLVLGRFGIGNIEKRALIFTLFQGRKSTSEYALSDSVDNHVNIMGYSVEAIIKKDNNTSLSAEFAKSTEPVTGNLQSNKQINSLWKFPDQTNMGINIKAQTIIPETKTKLSGFFRKTGENFQSFSLFSYNTNQTAWLARADEELYKNKITITGMLRQNDFTNPFTEKTYKTTTIFKSLLLNIRFPKYPSLSIGYYPGTQLYFIDREKIRENAYYVLNASLVYSYFYKTTGMNSSIVYNRYINQATDSGFTMYKGTNYYASQTIFIKKLQVQGGYAYNKQPELEYYTIETSGNYAVKNWLSFGAGAKYNKIGAGNNYWGERVQFTLNFKELGGLQFQYEKSYLPTINRTLFPVEIGRVSWYKYF